MNDFLAVTSSLTAAAALYALLAGTGTRRFAWLTLCTSNVVLIVVTDSSTTAHVLQGLTALLAAAGFIREVRKSGEVA